VKAFAGHKCTRSCGGCGFGDFIHESIIVLGIVVEQAQPADTGSVGQFDALLPAGMAPADMRGQFVIGVSGVKNQQVDALGQMQQLLIDGTGTDFDVCDVSDRTAVVFDAISSSAAGMKEWGRANFNARPQVERFASLKIAELHIGLPCFDLQRKQRRAHDLSDGALNTARRLQVAGPNPNRAVPCKERHEEWQTDDVIQMAMA